MLRIRQEHYDAYMEKKIGPIRDEIVLALRKRLPQETSRYSEQELKLLCNSGIVKAARYAIDSANGVYHFVAVMVICGHEFDTDPRRPWAQQILFNKTIGEDDKAAMLALHVVLETGKGL
jgi:hypothetical protein